MFQKTLSHLAGQKYSWTVTGAAGVCNCVDKLAILADRTVSTRMGKNARDVVERLFSEKTMVDRYERMLLDLCRTRSGAREAVPG